MELDPYKVLKVPYDADLVLIRSQFKKAVLKHHPDRGGNPKAFQIIKSAYSYLYKYKTNEAKQLANEQRTHEQAKQERKRQTKQLKQDFNQVQHNPHLKKINANSRNFDSRAFNTLFKEMRTDDADDRGYDIVESSKVRLDAGDLQKKYGKQQKKQMQIAVIEEPEPMELGTGNYKQLGLDHVDNFSKRHAGRGQGFTDLQQAYTNQQNMETMGNSRADSHLGKNANKQMSRLQQDRSAVSYKMNNKDFAMSEMKKQQEIAMEEQRRFRFNQQTEQSQKQFQRMQNYITFR